MVLKAEISSILKRTLPSCPACQAEVSEDDSFCQDCGGALLVSSPSSNPSSSLSPDPNPTPTTSPSPGPSPNPTPSPSPSPSPSRLERLHPSLSKPVIALPIVVCALVAVAAITFFLAGFEKSYSGFSSQYVVDQARQAYKDNRCDEAATFLERLAISHKLDEDSKTLLNDVYLARSSQRVERQDYSGAMADLDKIPPQYSKFVLVTGRKNELTELIRVRQLQQQAQSFPLPKNRSRLERSKNRLASKDSGTQSQTAQVSPAPQAMSASNSTGSNPQVVQMSSQAAAPRGDAMVAGTRGDLRLTAPRGDVQVAAASRGESQVGASRGVTSVAISRRDSAPGSQNQPGAQPDAGRSESAKGGSGKPKAAKITENDQVRYNELLAGYFSQEHKQSSATEPPSLKEWIDSGRPKF